MAGVGHNCERGAVASPRTRRRPLGAAVHGVVVMLILIGCLFMPRPGAAVLLVPIRPHPSSWHDVDLAASGLTLLGTGQVPGSLLVRSAQPIDVRAWLGRGLLPIAVPASFCGAAR